MNKLAQLESVEKSPKRAQVVAEQIERDIVRLGWPVGRCLGSEAELIARYGVGRWVMREAINIVVADGLLELRRGRTGGLFVAAPAEGAVITMLQNYLELSNAKLEDIVGARAVVEALAVQLAANRIDLQRADELRRRASNLEPAAIDDGELLREIFAISGNLAIYVFGCALINTTQAALDCRGFTDRDDQYRGKFSTWRRAQVEAIIAADPETAIAMQRKCDALWRQLGSALTREKNVGRRSISAALASKASDNLIRLLLDEIDAHEGEANFNLGGEAELLSRFGVSRETLREAIRRLERHGIVEMRLGRGDVGGLHITAANPAATVKSSALYLRYAKLPVESVYEMQIALDLAAVMHLTALPQSQRKIIAAELTRLAALPPNATVTIFETHVYVFYLHLSRRCGNAVIDLFIQIMASLITIEPTDGRAIVPADMIAKALSAVERLALAIVAAEAATARRCLLEIRRVGTLLKPHARSAEDIVAREFYGQWRERAFQSLAAKNHSKK